MLCTIFLNPFVFGCSEKLAKRKQKMLFEAGKNEIDSDEEHDLSSGVHSKVLIPEIASILSSGQSTRRRYVLYSHF